MNKKGFTLVELLATIIILGIVAGITVITVFPNLGKTKEKSEEIFVSNIKDALDIYLDSDAKDPKKLSFSSTPICTFSKSLKSNVKLYRSSSMIGFDDVAFNSSYKPMSVDDFVNPYNSEQCNYKFMIYIYRDEDYVYYYDINKSNLKCLTLKLDEKISNLPSNLPRECNID